jgi:hypothetical protein
VPPKCSCHKALVENDGFRYRPPRPSASTSGPLVGHSGSQGHPGLLCTKGSCTKMIRPTWCSIHGLLVRGHVQWQRKHATSLFETTGMGLRRRVDDLDNCARLWKMTPLPMISFGVCSTKQCNMPKSQVQRMCQRTYQADRLALYLWVEWVAIAIYKC